MTTKLTIISLVWLILFVVTGCTKPNEMPKNNNDDMPAGAIDLSEEEIEYIKSVRQEIRDSLPIFTSKDFDLPFFENEELSIEWTSSNPEIVSTEGKVFAQAILGSSYLEATIKYKNHEFKERVRVNVYPFSNTEKINYSKKYTFAYLYGEVSSFDLANIEKIDFINYSFGLINQEGKLYIPSTKGLNSVLKLKEHGMKVVLSIGGWGADGFSDAVYTAESRKVFIDSIMEAVRKYGLAGIDIDWEYPGTNAGGIKSRPVDKQNFTIFLNDLKNELVSYDPNLILTIAVGGNASLLEIPKIEKSLDFIHLMTYDLTNASPGQPAVHLSNLYPNIGGYSVERFVNSYTNAGMPVNKLVVGVAFYGHIHHVDNDGPRGNGLGASIKNRNSLSYDLIRSAYLNNENYQYYFDETAKAPWLYNSIDKIFITYDDPTSIKYKCEYVLSKDLGGLMFWQYTHDTSNTLLDAIHENLKLKA